MEPARIEVRDPLAVLPSGKHDLAAGSRRSYGPRNTRTTRRTTMWKPRQFFVALQS